MRNEEVDPNPIVDFDRLAEAFKDEIEFPACLLVRTLFKFICLRAAIRKGDSIAPTSIVNQLREFESELIIWARDLPRSWIFTTDHASSWAGPAGIPPHVYHDTWISRVWSHYRWIRISVHEAILEHLPRAPDQAISTIASQRLSSVSIIRHMAADICASVPFHLSNYNALKNQIFPHPDIVGAFDLMWPLAVVSGSEYVEEDVHTWAACVLDTIGKGMGIKQSLLLVSVAKSRRKSGLRSMEKSADAVRMM
jgi:hypothetical protein